MPKMQVERHRDIAVYGAYLRFIADGGMGLCRYIAMHRYIPMHMPLKLDRCMRYMMADSCVT